MPIAADFCRVPYVERFSCDTSREEISRRAPFDTSRVDLEELRIGSIFYPLRNKLTGNYVRAIEELFIDNVSPVFIGKGQTELEAIDSFSLEVHRAFQNLLYKRPFEMDGEEVVAWKTLNEMIDVSVYRNRTPMIVRQFGKVRWGSRPYPSEIEWDNGFKEPVHPRQVVSQDFVNFKPGEPIEAVVARDPLTRELIQVPYIVRARRLRSPREIEEAGLAERLGTLADLQDADWD